MAISLISFARDFENLKNRLQDHPVGDLRLLLMIEYWPRICEHTGDPRFSSFLEEYRSLLSSNIAPLVLDDLLPLELEQLLTIIKELRENPSCPGAVECLKVAEGLVAKEAAKKLFYAGAIEDGLEVLSRAAETESPLSELPYIDELSRLENLRRLCVHLQASGSESASIISTIIDNWANEHTALSYEEARCVFVEKNTLGTQVRGRLRRLRGNVRLLSKEAEYDELTFENQLKSPDDVFVGTIYHALHAVSTFQCQTAGSVCGGRHVRARYAISNSRHSFTGDSIGLAAALVAFVQLLKPEVHRQERLLALNVAFTGGLDNLGHLVPVNGDSLKLKVSRVFFSTVQYMALPEADIVKAQEYVSELSVVYPHRQLTLIGIRTLRDAVENRNIVRAERLCMGQFITRKARRYSQATKIQVPILLSLLYVLVCLMYPKAWFLFDRTPQYAVLTKNGFDVLNRDSVPLWSVTYECDSIRPFSHLAIGDMDEDGRNEVAFVPVAFETSLCPSNANLYLYDDNGILLYKRYCAILGGYPQDSSMNIPYCGNAVRMSSNGTAKLITTVVTKSNPSRAHLRFFNARGDSLGWFVNAGCAGDTDDNFLIDNDSTWVFMGFNNAIRSSCLFVLDPNNCFGVSPPYAGSTKDCQRGNQRHYMIFPQTDLNKYLGLAYNRPFGLSIKSAGVFTACVGEVEPGSEGFVYYAIDSNFRVIGVTLDDRFIERRNALVNQGVLEPIDWQVYRNNLLNSVTYWSDSGWVTEGSIRLQTSSD